MSVPFLLVRLKAVFQKSFHIYWAPSRFYFFLKKDAQYLWGILDIFIYREQHSQRAFKAGRETLEVKDENEKLNTLKNKVQFLSSILCQLLTIPSVVAWAASFWTALKQDCSHCWTQSGQVSTLPSPHPRTKPVACHNSFHLNISYKPPAFRTVLLLSRDRFAHSPSQRCRKRAFNAKWINESEVLFQKCCEQDRYPLPLKENNRELETFLFPHGLWGSVGTVM